MAKRTSKATTKTKGRKAPSPEGKRSQAKKDVAPAATARRRRAQAGSTPARGAKKAAPVKKAPAKKAPPIARKRRPRASGLSRPSSSQLDALDAIRDELAKRLGARVTLQSDAVPAGRGRTPWSVVAELRGFDVSYAQLADALAAVERSRKVERLAGERTYSRIAVVYNGARHRGRRGRTQREWTAGEIAPWGVTAARAARKVATASATYGDASNPAGPSRAIAVRVWLSSESAAGMIDDGGDDGDE